MGRALGTENLDDLGLKLVGDPGTRVMLVGDFEEHLLDLGPKLGADLLGIDGDAEPVGGPGGEAVAIIPGALLPLRSLGQELGQADPDGELGFLAGVKLAGLLLELLDHLRTW